MNRFLANRYGLDAYSIFLLLFSLLFIQTHYLWVIGIALVGYALFRILSKDKAKRYSEFQKFSLIYQKFIYKGNQVIFKIKSFFSLKKKHLSERKDYVFLRCPKCRKTLRLPKKKGKLEVTCPVCREIFFRKT